MGKVVTCFLAMPVCNIATGQSLFDALEAELSRQIVQSPGKTLLDLLQIVPV